MAEESIILKVGINTDEVQRELSAAIKGVADLTEEQKRLTKEIKAGNDADGSMAKSLANVTAELEKNKREVKSKTAILQAATAANLKENASLDEQRQALNTLQKAAAAMTEEQRKMDIGGTTLEKEIKSLTDSIREQEHALGDDRRNVGNYIESIQKAIPDLGKLKGTIEGVAGGSTKMSKAIDGTDKVMKGMIANPFFGTIFLLGGVLSMIAEYLKQNEEAADGLHKVTAGIGGSLKALKPILEWLTKFLVDNLLKAIDWVMDAIKSVLGWIDKVAKRFGKDLNLAAAFEEGSKAARELTEEEKKAAEEAKKVEEEKVKKITALREELKKRRMTDMEREIYELQKRADEELKTAKLTAAEKAEIDSYYQEQMNAVRQKYADEEAKRLEEEAKKTEEAERKKLEARQKALEEFGLEEGETMEQKELRLLQEAREQDLINAEEYEIAKTLIAEKYSKKRQEDIDAEVKRAKTLYEQSVKSASSATGAALSALSDLLGEYAESSEEAAKAQKAFAFGAILINQAMSIAEGAKGIAAAMAGAAEAAAATGPAAPFTLIAYQAQMVGQVLAVVASVASTIVQAKQLFSQAEKHKDGALIPGVYDGKDDIPAWLSKGEIVLNPKQASTALWNMANNTMSGYSYEKMAAAMASAVSTMPAPVVSIKELADEQDKVSTFNEFAAI